MKEVLQLAWKLKDQKQLRLYILFLLLCGVGNSFINSISKLYFIENGFPTSIFAAIELFHLPLELFFSVMTGKLKKEKQIERFYLVKLILAFQVCKVKYTIKCQIGYFIHIFCLLSFIKLLKRRRQLTNSYVIRFNDRSSNN